MTASNVLRPRKLGVRPMYSEETARRVLMTAEKLGYVPNRAARAMRTKRTGVVGFVAANFSESGETVENYGVHPFLVGLNHVLTPSGRHVAMIELNELELKKSEMLPGALRERFFDALVVHYGLSSRALHLLEEYEIPTIYWDSGIFHKENCVHRDEFEVGQIVTRRMLELGHRKIALTVGRENWLGYQKGGSVHYSFANRYEGFASVMKEKGLRPRVLVGYQGEELAEQIEKEQITGVIVQGGYMQVLTAAMLLGKKIPKDISVLSCDLEASVKTRGDAAGGARYNRYQAGRTVGELLLKRLENEGVSVPSVRLPVEIVDGSTAIPRSSK
jgi:LacI family transcriptional regulator